MAKKRFHGQYEGSDSRFSQESRDSGMISENRSAVANLPQEVVMKSWEMDYPAMGEPLDDTERSIKNQVNQDGRSRSIKRGSYPEKY